MTPGFALRVLLAPKLGVFLPPLEVWARFEAFEVKATRSHVPSTATSKLSPSDCAPVEETDTRCRRPESSQYTNASALPLVSPGTRFDACETNATQLGGVSSEPREELASPEIAGS